MRTGWFWLAGAVATAMGVAFAPPRASADEFFDRCLGKQPSDQAAIAAITSCIESGRYPAKLGVLYFNRGSVYHAAGNFDAAIADYTQAIGLDAPSAALYYFYRARAYAVRGDADTARADFDRVIQLNPRNARAYRARGILNYASGAFDKALADFNQSYALVPTDPYVALWLEIAGRQSRLPSRLAEAAARLDMTRWPAPVIRLYLGQMTPEAVLAAADNPDANEKLDEQCDAMMFTAELALLQGRPDAARPQFQSVVSRCFKKSDSFEVAQAELRKPRQGP
jgi:lipoprotein NlpI